jgi:hypothetical protein
MSDVDQILEGPDYFYCERGHCKLRIDICIGRQKANKERRPFQPRAYEICENCKQGAENWRTKGLDKKLKAKPRRGKGERNEDCELYADCLSKAAKKDWKTINCQSCPQYEGEKVVAEKEKNTRICEECKEKATISPKHPLCASCLAVKSNAKRAANKAKEKEKKNAAQGKGKGEKSQPRGDLELVVNFGKHGDVLKQIEALAEDELRPINMQVVYMLKRFLEAT